MKIITIASTKGGVGKSTFVINLATTLLKLGNKVAALDADMQGTLSKWAKVRSYFTEQDSKITPLFVAGVQGETLLEIANDKKKQGYFVLIDSPGVDDSNMRNALLRSDIVITISPTSAVDLWEVESLINILKKLKTIQNRPIPLFLVFNKVHTRHDQASIKEATTFFDQNNIYPDVIINSVIKDRSIFKNSIKFGKGVIELGQQDKKATTEMVNCCKEIINIIYTRYI
uniref:ParA family protein n=2 Tax=Cardinium endosymbiont of Bemisia tabaci TaxID=672794 RepID=UPI000442CF11|nr:ParA family protein [Cardinium endosymbiont of Bemisia tabaci]CDG50396.1 Chromosome partitioning protein ParA [Cardinium endosymbiont cBtQ1 of Bemisia tabaci]